ncbi:hypothetical protein COLO4_06919 [Corchorus olitorius]|uniref:Uncharacterized protein n=1 Tax=Corchorus olitorius TaxID=93759 RepID=A0A1R3KLI2_9ROSI|nr:hypothetical protein COLO4_06919 [Corchorus olitorius]
MADLPPIEDLSIMAQDIIKIGQVEMNLDYPNMQPNHLFVLPIPEETVKKLQHGHIQKEIYIPGLANYLAPISKPKTPITDPFYVHLKSAKPRLSLDGDHHRVFLVTTAPNYGIRLSLQFSVNPLSATTNHKLGLNLQLKKDNWNEQPCKICKRSPNSSIRYVPPSIQTRLMLYNATGAASASFPLELAKHHRNFQPHIVIITETRLPARHAKRIASSFELDQFHGLDALGLCRGSWIAWKGAFANVDVIDKAPCKLTVDFKLTV